MPKSQHLLPIPAGHWCVHIDGSAMPNPGRMAIGAVLRAPDGQWHGVSQVLPGTGCNNEAELQALAVALLQVQSRGGTQVVVHTDSAVLVEQLGPLPHKPMVRLASHFAQVRDLMAQFAHVDLRWIPRHRNLEADALARAALLPAT